jgi:hypothetical protein
MNAFIDYADAAGDAYDGLVANLRKDAVKLSAVRPLGDLVRRIGDSSHGHKGHLHICNFLYCQIPAPEIRLTKVIALYNKDHSAAPIAPANIKKITFSCGPSFSLDRAAWKANSPRPRGAIAFSIALQFHDPLEDEVIALKEQLQRLQDEITNALDSIKQSLGAGGVIRRTVAKIENTTDKSLLEIQGTRSDIRSCEIQVDAQSQTLAHIKSQVDAL